MLSPKNYPKFYGKIENSEDSEDSKDSKNSNPPEFHVANGESRIASKDFPKYRHGIFIKNKNPRYFIIDYRSSNLYKNGWISEQNLQANLASKIFMGNVIYNTKINKILNPIILDTCSAPGHKTTAMAEWGYYFQRNNDKLKKEDRWFKIISIDRSKNRLEHLKRDIKRLGIKKIEILVSKLRNILKIKPELENNADFVMFDPPCSALGTRSKLYIDKTAKLLNDYPKNQLRLLKIVDNLIKTGGFLMYNTCTILKEENEEICRYAINKLGYKAVSPVPVSPDEKYIKFGNPGISVENLEKSETDKFIRFYPKKDDRIGYFIALLKKI